MKIKVFRLETKDYPEITLENLKDLKKLSKKFKTPIFIIENFLVDLQLKDNIEYIKDIRETKNRTLYFIIKDGCIYKYIKEV